MKLYDNIPDTLATWIKKQHLFYVATAPLTGEGHVNLSPKGTDGTFHIVGPNRVWYEDLSGSGIETISHLRENGRITIMFCAFEGAARILRLYGRGSVHEFGTPEYDALVPPAKRHASSRAAIVIDVYKVATSCGYAVPLYTFKAERSALTHWGSKMEKIDGQFPPHFVADEESHWEGTAADQPVPMVTLDTAAGPRVYAKNGLKLWWASFNQRSHDGLPGLSSAHLSDLPLETGVEVRGLPEPLSDGTVVILGNRVPKASSLSVGIAELWAGKEALVPRSGAEAVRLAVVFVLGLVLATAYGQGVRQVLADRVSTAV